jgi:RNA methyltransferase, TrmH family
MRDKEIITSVYNPRVKNVEGLREKKARDSRRLMLIDGYRAVSLALNNQIPLKELFYCEKFFKSREEKVLIERAEKNGAKIFCLNEKVFARVAYGDNPEGILAVAGQVKKDLADLPLGKSALYLVLESLEKPGNLGAILRTADAAAVCGIIVCDSRTDIYNPNVIRSSLGAFFTIPVVESSVTAALTWLKEQRIKILTTTLQAKLEYTRIDYADPCAIVLGSEDKGVSSAWLDAADFKVKIPMQGQVDSLNVATAAAIILYEALRQKNAKTK